MKPGSNARGAFTRIELIVAVLSLVLVVGVSVIGVIQSTRRAQLATCVANQKQITRAHFVWIHENETGNLLSEISTNAGGVLEYMSSGEMFQYFKALSNQPTILICPSDNRKAATNRMSLGNSNLSYFVNIDGFRMISSSGYCFAAPPRLIVTGDRNVTNGAGPTAGIISVTASNSHQLSWDGRMHNRFRKPSAALIGNVAYLDGSVETINTTNLQSPFKSIVSPSVTSRLVIP